jgi:SAM-dependent methyltransferase
MLSASSSVYAYRPRSKWFIRGGKSVMSEFGTHSGFGHNRRWWDWASFDDHNKWVTGAEPPENYDASGWQAALQLISHCPDYRDLTVLEWGCGSGRVTQYLAYLFRHVWAVDIAPGMIERVRQKQLPSTSLHVTEGAKLPAGLTVDIVYSLKCWFHNLKPDLVPILHSSRLALRPGGRLVFQLPIYDTPQDPKDFQDIACWTRQEFIDLAAATEFEIVRMHTNPGTFSYFNVGINHFNLHEWIPR